jgi:hypothetical protein
MPPHYATFFSLPDNLQDRIFDQVSIRELQSLTLTSPAGASVVRRYLDGFGAGQLPLEKIAQTAASFDDDRIAKVLFVASARYQYSWAMSANAVASMYTDLYGQHALGPGGASPWPLRLWAGARLLPCEDFPYDWVEVLEGLDSYGFKFCTHGSTELDFRGQLQPEGFRFQLRVVVMNMEFTAAEVAGHLLYLRQRYPMFQGPPFLVDSYSWGRSGLKHLSTLGLVQAKDEPPFMGLGPVRINVPLGREGTPDLAD